jgi:hypothetical protein
MRIENITISEKKKIKREDKCWILEVRGQM